MVLFNKCALSVRTHTHSLWTHVDLPLGKANSEIMKECSLVQVDK